MLFRNNQGSFKIKEQFGINNMYDRNDYSDSIREKVEKFSTFFRFKRIVANASFKMKSGSRKWRFHKYDRWTTGAKKRKRDSLLAAWMNHQKVKHVNSVSSLVTRENVGWFRFAVNARAFIFNRGRSTRHTQTQHNVTSYPISNSCHISFTSDQGQLTSFYDIEIEEKLLRNIHRFTFNLYNNNLFSLPLFFLTFCGINKFSMRNIVA